MLNLPFAIGIKILFWAGLERSRDLQPLAVAGPGEVLIEGGEAAGDEQGADGDEQEPGYDLDDARIAAHLAEHALGVGEGEPGDEERECQAGGVSDEQISALKRVAAGCTEGEDPAQDRANAWCPAERPARAD